MANLALDCSLTPKHAHDILCQCPALESCYLTQSQPSSVLSDRAETLLSKLRCLRLRLTSPSVDEFFTHLSLPALEDLGVQYFDLEHWPLSHLQASIIRWSCTLKCLNIAHSTLSEDEFIILLQNVAHSLVELRLTSVCFSSSHFLGDELLASLTVSESHPRFPICLCPQLERIDIYYNCGLSSDGILAAMVKSRLTEGAAIDSVAEQVSSAVAHLRYIRVVLSASNRRFHIIDLKRLEGLQSTGFEVDVISLPMSSMQMVWPAEE